MKFDLNNFNDHNVWDLICEGRTKGVFQLESQLGRSWAKRVKPRNIEELSALISLIRPGCLKAFTEGKSMTNHYVDRKSKKDETKFLHESLEDILSETYGVLVYQEQSMRIVQKLAGFDLKEADNLRKAIGKKQAALMGKIKKDFLKGCSKQKMVPKKIAEEIFSWIEKSNRYAFNKSHAVSYAINAYWSAYCKYYRTVRFFTTYLNHAERKPDPKQEVKELVMDCKMNDIEVYPPRLKYFFESFTSVDNNIYFGVSHVKQVGGSFGSIMEQVSQVEKPFRDWNWMDVLCNIKINKQSMVSLISVGGFSGENNSKYRNEMLYEFSAWKTLTAREIEWIKENRDGCDSLLGCIRHMINNFKITTNRLQKLADMQQMLENPPYSLEDSAQSIAENEEKLLGCALTCGKTDYLDNNLVNSVCKDVALGIIKGKVNLAVQINSVREYKTKKGKNPGQIMAFLGVEDSSGHLDSATIFPEDYDKNKNLLVEGNTVLLVSETSKRDNGIIIKDVQQI